MGQLVRSRRYQALLEQTRDELRKYTAYMDSSVTAGQRSMISTAIQHSATAVNAVATEAQIVVPFNRLPVSAVENMVGLAGDGSPLRAVLNDAARAGPDAMAQELVNGIALGRNPIAVARRAIRIGLGQSFTRMQTISRTEMLRTYRVTTQTAYERSNVVVGYRRLSARDDRVCAGCLMSDGRTYPLDVNFESHVNCRCSLVPILRNVPPVQFQTGQEWFRQQPEAAQRRILGAGRFVAWQNGASLDDMVTVVPNATWGDAIVPTLVRNLP
jgi:SPP1 gp7 family putative phage head morphogenesis protein